MKTVISLIVTALWMWLCWYVFSNMDLKSDLAISGAGSFTTITAIIIWHIIKTAFTNQKTEI